MKKLLIIFAFLITGVAIGQVSKVKAVEHKGVTTAVRDGLNTTGVFPVIYNITTGQFERWNGVAWEAWGADGGSEVNDLSSVVTWANVPDANITESSVTQHQAALSITESQISDLQSYLTSLNGVTSANITDETIDEADLDASVNASLDLADSASQTDDQTASEVPVTDSGANYTATDVEGILAEIAPQLGGIGTDDQTASEVNITDSGGNYTATTVEAALAEIFDETVKVDPASPIQTISLALADTEAELTGLGANTIGFSKDGGTTLTASGIANVPSGNLVATDVQAALNELQTELDGAVGGGDDVSTFSEKSGALVGTDRLVGLSGATDFNETISGIPLSIFNDDLTHTTDTNLTQEEVEDFAGGLVSSAGDGLVYSDVGGTLAVVDSEITITESQISDLSHTPDTNTLGSDGDKGDITVGGTGTTLTIDDSAVTNSKILDNTIEVSKIERTNGTLGAGEDNYVLTYDNATGGVTLVESLPLPEAIQIACSDLSTDVTTGTTKAYFRMPYAMTLTEVRVSLLTAGTTTGITVDIKESGVSVLSTLLTTDATEETSETAATAAVISDSALADDAEITIGFNAVPIGGQGVIVTLIGTRT